MTREQLELSALEAHREGIPWHDFHLEHGTAITAAKPDPVERAKLVGLLMHLTVSGERSGQFPIGDLGSLEPTPDVPSPHDTATRAKYTAPPMEQATMFDVTPEYA